MDVTQLDFGQIQTLLDKGFLSCRELVENYLKKMAEGKQLNAFISIFDEQARERAREIDEKIKKKSAGELAGLILAVKDNILIRGSKTTCGSRMLANFIAPYNATVIEKLYREDAIFIGKTNMDEFAMGSSNENSFFGHVKNPFDEQRVPGGSSGGSAAAVAAFQATAALGSDTGGSIRQPAAFCGLVGLKPTYGAVSRYGLIAYASSFDQIGPIARSVDDCQKIYAIIAGRDPLDSTSRDVNFHPMNGESDSDLAKLTIGIPEDRFFGDVQIEIIEKLSEIVKKLEKEGINIVTISLPHAKYAVPAYYIIATAEASSNLSRFDGVRYGFRSEETDDLHQFYSKNRSIGFGDEVKTRILLGTFVLSHGYYERYYRKAQAVRELVRLDFKNAFQHCDVILTPTTPTTPFAIGEKKGDSLAMYLSDVFTVAANLTGLPALNVPCGKSKDRMPVGLQLMGKEFSEPLLFYLAKKIEDFG